MHKYLGLLLFVGYSQQFLWADDSFFESKVRPLLVKHCYECHSGEKTKGGLALDTRAGWEKGGDNGPAIIPGKPEQSHLIKAIRHEDKSLAMPPKSRGGKLNDADISILVQWVKMGAPDPRKLAGKIGGMTEAQAKSWWSFQPLGQANAIPSQLKSNQQNFNRADKRTLIRRATYDLTGLPPTPAEVQQYLADNSQGDFDRLVERLLASPGYGEKWGRHWLDVVRYADSAGENSDVPLAHAWRYRNWVINAIQQDMPYDEFVRQQIAGDIMAAKEPANTANDKIIATGFLAVARRFGHEIQKEMHLTYEDTLDTMGKTFLGLSLGCARCHDHKYDPISTRDYYGLYGILQSTRFPFTGCESKPQPRDMVPIASAETLARHAAWEKEMTTFEAAVKAAEGALASHSKLFEKSTPTLLASGDLKPVDSQAFVVGQKSLPEPLKVEQGEMLQLTVLPKANMGGDSTLVEWIIQEEGGAKREWNLTADFLEDTFNGGNGMQHGDRHGNKSVWHLYDVVPGPRLFTEYEKDAEKQSGLMVWRGGSLWPGVMFNTRNEVLKFQTVTLPARSVAVHPGPKGGVAIAWESPANLAIRVHGKITKADAGGDGVAWKLERRPGIGRGLTEQKSLLKNLTAATKERDAAKARMPVVEVALATLEDKTANARIQKKGEPKDLGDEVPRKMPDIFGGSMVPINQGSGRMEMAQWLTQGSASPLLARVMANRIWAGHFGTGIVPTLNDFGSRGDQPSQPELLEYLAAQFANNGWSMKTLHRLIMRSDSYQARDFPRRRLTAEEMRDTMLAVSESLDRTPGGPHPFPSESNWKFTQHNPFKAVYDNNKRSVYQMVQRTQRHPFLSLFDGADPNASTPLRTQSTVPTQALYFLNDPFVHGQAKAMATRLLASATNDEARLDLATNRLFARPATQEEISLMREFLAATMQSLQAKPAEARNLEAWTGWVRVLFGSNELMYVD